jgi:hypothetical protein
MADARIAVTLAVCGDTRRSRSLSIRLGVGPRVVIGAVEFERVMQDGRRQAFQKVAVPLNDFASRQTATLAREDSRFARKALERCCLKARRGVADRVELAEGGFVSLLSSRSASLSASMSVVAA